MHEIYHKEEHVYKDTKIRIRVRDRFGKGVDVIGSVNYKDEWTPKGGSDGTWPRRIYNKLTGRSIRDRIEDVKTECENWIDQAEKIEREAEKKE